MTSVSDRLPSSFPSKDRGPNDPLDLTIKWAAGKFSQRIHVFLQDNHWKTPCQSTSAYLRMSIFSFLIASSPARVSQTSRRSLSLITSPRGQLTYRPPSLTLTLVLKSVLSYPIRSVRMFNPGINMRLHACHW